MTARPHTTHHDDCGCLSARHAAEIADANATIRRLQARLDAVRPVVRMVIEWADSDASTSRVLSHLISAAVRAWAEGGGE